MASPLGVLALPVDKQNLPGYFCTCVNRYLGTRLQYPLRTSSLPALRRHALSNIREVQYLTGTQPHISVLNLQPLQPSSLTERDMLLRRVPSSYILNRLAFCLWPNGVERHVVAASY
jgi:hypothetical protein